jgi:hypothetical protein
MSAETLIAYVLFCEATCVVTWSLSTPDLVVAHKSDRPPQYGLSSILVDCLTIMCVR